MYPRAIEHYAHHYKMRYPEQESETSRRLRLSPLHHRLQEQGAVYGSKNGWERPLWFAPDGVEALDQLSFLDPGWTRFVADEHEAVRSGVVLIDQTSFSKFELIGPGALRTIQGLTVSNMDRPAGSVTYTQMCNERGGIEADVTVTRLDLNHFYIITGAGFGVHDSDWIGRHLPADGSASLIEVTSAWAVINLCGPEAREVLRAVTDQDVSNEAFPYGTARNLTIGASPVRALRIGYVGELGWELHIPTEFTLHVHGLLRASGEAFGMRNVGYRALESLRMEKGYLYWSSDISPDYNPYEAGLGGRVHLKSKGDFIGRAALEEVRRSGPSRRLRTFASDESPPLHGGETILADDSVVSLVTSAAYGHTIGRTIMMGYLPVETDAGARFSVEAFGDRFAIERVEGPLYDGQNARLRA